jgi:hypothetical protein
MPVEPMSKTPDVAKPTVKAHSAAKPAQSLMQNPLDRKIIFAHLFGRVDTWKDKTVG